MCIYMRFLKHMILLGRDNSVACVLLTISVTIQPPQDSLNVNMDA